MSSRADSPRGVLIITGNDQTGEAWNILLPRFHFSLEGMLWKAPSRLRRCSTGQCTTKQSSGKKEEIR